ncbi:MAG TPA: hypothetical protein VHK68_12670 [Gemmatimonadales bacterium]|nr:hypothetical protein [Gemmatimonadales bacterium]
MPVPLPACRSRTGRSIGSRSRGALRALGMDHLSGPIALRPNGKPRLPGDHRSGRPLPGREQFVQRDLGLPRHD